MSKLPVGEIRNVDKKQNNNWNSDEFTNFYENIDEFSAENANEDSTTNNKNSTIIRREDDEIFRQRLEEYVRKIAKILKSKDKQIQKLQTRLNDITTAENDNSVKNFMVNDRSTKDSLSNSIIAVGGSGNSMTENHGNNNNKRALASSLRVQKKLRQDLKWLRQNFEKEQLKWISENEYLKLKVRDLESNLASLEVMNYSSPNPVDPIPQPVDDQILIDMHEKEMQKMMQQNGSVSTNKSLLDQLVKSDDFDSKNNNVVTALLLKPVKTGLVAEPDCVTNNQQNNHVIALEQIKKNSGVIFEHNNDELILFTQNQNRLLTVENYRLKRAVEQMKDRYEVADIESEGKISVLANKLEELEDLLEAKSRELVVINTELNEKIASHKRSETRVKNLCAQFSRQKDLTEQANDELDKLNSKFKEMCKDKNDLLLMNASLNHELNFYKKKSYGDRMKILEQLNLAGKELQDCIVNLKTVENFNGPNNVATVALISNGVSSSNSFQSSNTHLSSSVANITAKIEALEKDMTYKQRAIDNVEDSLQQIRFSLLKKYSFSNDRF